MDDIFELTEIEEEILDRLGQRISYKEEIFGNKRNYELILEDLLINSRNIALSRIYPFYDYSTKKLPIKYADWQYRCCIELYNLADKTGFKTYSENGLSWGKATDGISLELLNEITSKAGIPSKVKDEEDENE